MQQQVCSAETFADIFIPVLRQFSGFVPSRGFLTLKVKEGYLLSIGS